MHFFNNYKLSKNDKQLIKNFKLDNQYEILAKEELDDVWKRILTTEEVKLKHLYAALRNMKGYKTIINGTEYLIYSYYEKNFYNLFFYNLNSKELEEQLDNSKEKIVLFSKMCDILVHELKSDKCLNYRINFPKRNLKLYFYLINKTIKYSGTYKKFVIKKIKRLYYFYNKDSRVGPLPLFYLREKIISYKKPFANRIKILKVLRNINNI